MTEVAVYDFDAGVQPPTHEVTLRHRIRHGTNYTGACFKQRPCEPATEQTSCAGHEHRPILPELFVEMSRHVRTQDQTFHGGLLLRHKFSNSLTSRIVSMHCQNASCRNAASCLSAASCSSASASRLLSSSFR